MQKADEIRYKEERKIIAGYSSGRKAPEVKLACFGYQIMKLLNLFLSSHYLLVSYLEQISAAILIVFLTVF